MTITPHGTLLMIGDSITDAGRARPRRETEGDEPAAAALAAGLGTGYVALVHALLAAARPEAAVRVVNRGVSGDTVRDLARRWAADVLDARPDWLSVMIGVNDAGRQLFARPGSADVIGFDEFERTLADLVGRARAMVKGVVLLTPFFVAPDPADSVRVVVDRFGAAVKAVAGRTGAILVDTQAAFDAAMRHHAPAALAPDGVHPSMVGHMVIARAFLNAVGFAW